MRRSTLALAALLAAAPLACASTSARPTPPGASAESPAGVLARLVSALEDGRWEEAYVLLAARWRSRTTPVRLRADYRASGPVGPEAAARLAALLRAGADLQVGPGEALLAVGEGRRARLVREEAGWRVDALE